MTTDLSLAYVKASAALLGLPLDGKQMARVAGHLERTAVMAQMLEALDLAPETEIAEIYCPMPFLPASNGPGAL